MRIFLLIFFNFLLFLGCISILGACTSKSIISDSRKPSADELFSPEYQKECFRTIGATYVGEDKLSDEQIAMICNDKNLNLKLIKSIRGSTTSNESKIAIAEAITISKNVSDSEVSCAYRLRRASHLSPPLTEAIRICRGQQPDPTPKEIEKLYPLGKNIYAVALIQEVDGSTLVIGPHYRDGEEFLPVGLTDKISGMQLRIIQQHTFWLDDYFKRLIDVDKQPVGSITSICKLISDNLEVLSFKASRASTYNDDKKIEIQVIDTKGMPLAKTDKESNKIVTKIYCK